MNFKIRPEQTKDHPFVYEVIKSAFGQDNESKLVDALRKSNAFISELSIVALLDKKIVGYILFTKLKIRNVIGIEFDSLALAPMSVEPEFQKKGIGGKLIRFGLRKAKELGYKSVIVLGHADYYPKFGFLPAKNWNIKPPFDVPSDVFMAIELVENGLKNVSGTVIYPDEFKTAG